MELDDLMSHPKLIRPTTTTASQGARGQGTYALLENHRQKTKNFRLHMGTLSIFLTSPSPTTNPTPTQIFWQHGFAMVYRWSSATTGR